MLNTKPASDWTSVSAFPGMVDSQDQFHYQTFLIAPGRATFLQIILDDPNNQVFGAAYADAYDPSNPSQNYLGDQGNSVSAHSDPRYFQLIAPAGHNVVVVVSQATLAGGELGSPFTLLVEGFGDTEFNPPTPPPSAPTLVSPADSATGVSLTPELTWNAVSGATSYDVYFGTVAAPPLAGNVSSTDYSPPALLPLSRYYWQIASRNAGGTAPSAVHSFTTLGPQINSGGISSSAAAITQVARGELATIYGVDFTPAGVMAQAQAIPFPLSLAGVSVTVGGVTAPLYYVDSTQIDFQVPFEVSGNSAQVVVTANTVVSQPATVRLADYAVGIFGYYRTPAIYDPVIVHLDNSLVTPAHPAAPGETITIYATGIGLLANAPATGAGAPGPPQLAAAVDTPTVTIGQAADTQSAQVLYAGLSPGSVGLAQLDITIPLTLPQQDAPLTIAFPNNTSPSVTLYLTPPAAGSP